MIRPGRPGAAAVLAAVLCWGCESGPDHERLGDRRYAAQAFVDALAEYRLAARQREPSVELRAKLAMAALHVGALDEAVETYRAMAGADAAAAADAADGLVRAARLAVQARDVVALRRAFAALSEIAPARPVGALGAGLASRHEPDLGAPNAADQVLAAAAHSGTAGGADSLLIAWADLHARASRCDVAVRGYQAVLRREPLTGLARVARGGMAGCAVEAGRRALSSGELGQAEDAFRRAIALGAPDSTVRVAWLLLGDTRWAGGDSAAAADAYRRAAADGEDADPSVARAQEQLRRLLGAGNPQP